MHNVIRFSIPLGALLAALAVGLGAYAAHGLDKLLLSKGYVTDLQQRLEWVETGVRYQMYHALGLVLVGIIARTAEPNNLLTATVMAFLFGILLFSGSLYTMSVVSAQYRWLGAIVPLGGVSFIVGWICLAWASWSA